MTKYNAIKITSIVVLIGMLLPVGVAAPAFADGTLFTGTDNEEFEDEELPDKIGKYQTSGPNIIDGENIEVDFFVNGIVAIEDILLTGIPLTNELRTATFDGFELDTFVADIPNECCNEDMAYDGTNVWHAWFDGPSNGEIQKLDPDNLDGPALEKFTQPDVIGITLIEGEIWITKWTAQQVGTWDPDSNTFIPVFSTSPNNAGGLAYDADSGVLWVGTQGGSVTPYDLDGNVIGESFTPFGDIPNTIDSLEFVPEKRIVAGQLLSTDSTSLVIAGIQSSIVWMIPTVSGLAGTAILIAKFRHNKN